MTEDPYRLEEKTPEAPRARNRFVLFTLLGALGVVIGAIIKLATSNGSIWPYVVTIGSPLLCVCLHAWITLRNDEKYARSANFADMTYYMGFLFTLWTLVVAMFSYIFRDNTGGDVLVFSLLLESLPEFGAALISTIAGMIWRLYLTGFEEERDEFQDQSVAILNSQTRLLDILRQEVNKIIEGIQTASRDWMETMRKSSDDTMRIFDETTGQYQRIFEKTSRKFGENMEGGQEKIKEALDGFASDIGSSAQTLVHTAELERQKVRGAFEHMGNTISAAAQETESTLQKASRSIGESAGRMAHGFDEAQGRIKQGADEAIQKIAPLLETIGSLNSAVVEAGSELRWMTEGIRTAAEKIKEIEAVNPGLAAQAAREYAESLRSNTVDLGDKTRKIHDLADQIRSEAHGALKQVEETSRRLFEAQVPERLGQSLRDAQSEADLLREKLEKAAKKSPKTLWERIKAVFTG